MVEAGADVLVAGSFVFKAENPTQTIASTNCLAFLLVTPPSISIMVEAFFRVIKSFSFVFKAENPTQTIAELKALTAF